MYKVLLPLNLSAIYPQWKIQPSLWVSGLPGFILVVCLILFCWNRKTWGRPCFFALGYFIVMLFPVLGFFDQGFYQYSLVSDHWLYYAIVAPIALVIATGEFICRQEAWKRDWGLRAVVALLVVLGMATWTRAGVYATSESLWRDTLAKNPNAWVAHNNLALIFLARGELPEAVAQYQLALQIKPDYADAHNNWGIALQQAGNMEEAKKHTGKPSASNRVRPGAHQPRSRLGRVWPPTRRDRPSPAGGKDRTGQRRGVLRPRCCPGAIRPNAGSHQPLPASAAAQARLHPRAKRARPSASQPLKSPKTNLGSFRSAPCLRAPSSL